MLFTKRRASKRSLLAAYWTNKALKLLNLADGLKRYLNRLTSQRGTKRKIYS